MLQNVTLAQITVIVLLLLGQDATLQGDEVVARNPRREDKNPGSFKFNVTTTAWADFALENTAGRGLVSFVAYVKNCSEQEAENYIQQRLAELEANPPPVPFTPSTTAKAVSKALTPVPASVGLPPRPDDIGSPSMEFPYRDHHGDLLFLVRRYETPVGGKKVVAWTYRLPLGPSAKPPLGTWKPQKPEKPWPIYGLDRLAARPGATVLVAEGEKAADAAERLLDGVGVTVLNGASSVTHADLTPLFGRDIVILPDNDAPGRKYALDLIMGLAGKAKSLRIVDVWSLGWQPGQDVADFEALSGDFLDKALLVADWLTPAEAEQLANQQAQTEREAKIAELAQLDRVAYDAQRKEAAKAMKIRVSVLDQQVVQTRKATTSPAPLGSRCAPVVLETAEPWSLPVDGTALAEEILARIQAHCVLPEGAAVALTLFAFHSYCPDVSDFTPYVVLTSAVKRSGKSTVLDVLAEIVAKPLKSHNCSTAALFRLIATHGCTLLLDEADTFVGTNEDLRGVLNSGFHRDGQVHRVEGDGKDRQVVAFPTFCPKIMAGIGTLPATIMDRAIQVRMKRKARGSEVSKFNRLNRAACHPLRSKLSRWANDHQHELAAVRVQGLPCFTDRAEDTWEALLQIAHLLGPEWEARAFEAARMLGCRPEDRDEGDLGLDLLEDIRALTEGKEFLKVTSAWLCTELAGIEGAHWATHSHHKPLSQVDLGKLLKPFEIHPRSIRVDTRTARNPEQRGTTFRGFMVADFADAWERYLPSIPPDLTPVESSAAEEDPKPDDDPPPRGSPPPPRTTTDAPGEGAAGPAFAPEAPSVAADQTNEGEVGDLDALTVLHPLTQAPLAVRYLTDRDEAKAAVAALVASGQILGADTETTGLNPREDNLRLVQLTDGEQVLVLDCLHLGAPLHDVLGVLEEAPVVFHNALFDLAFLKANGVKLRTVCCTQLQAAALLHRPGSTLKHRRTLALAQVAEAFLEVTVDKAAQRSDWTLPELSPSQVSYAALDALLAQVLYEHLAQELKNEGTGQGFGLVLATLPAVAAAQERGILIDHQARAALIETLTPRRDEALKDLRAVIGPTINPNSPPQLAAYLEQTLDPATLAAWERTPKGQLSLTEDTLRAYPDLPVVKPLLRYREVADILKTWGVKYARYIDPAGRIHPGFHLLGARSGRMACSEPNMQNLPREPALRACFIAPPGYQLLTADFSQIELRIAGLLSGDRVIRTAYDQGQDLHREIVARITGKPPAEVTPDERKLGKALNFGLLYGAGAETFRRRAWLDYDIHLASAEARRFKEVFDQTYQVLRTWQEQNHRLVERQGWLQSPAGRRIYVKNPGNCYTVARNYPVQGAAADLMMLAIQRTHAALLQAKVPAFLVNFVHDELVLEVADDAVAQVKDLVNQAMTSAFLDLFREYDPAPLARNLVEIGVGANYASAK